MKKAITAAIMTTVLFISCANAEEVVDYGGAVVAPAEINHNDSIYFTQTDFYDLKPVGDRIILEKYPTYQQKSDFSCGPACALTILNYFGNREYDEAILVKKMGTKPYIGTNLSNMAKFFEEIGWEVESSVNFEPMKDDEAFQQFVIRNLSEGKPIMVENVEYGGHWRVIIGYDGMGTENTYDDVLIFADPFDTSDHAQDGYGVESFDRFYSMWFDHNMLPESERNQPWLIATPKRG